MTAQHTQAQWFDKLKSFVPSTFTENEGLFTAVFYGVAKALSASGEMIDLQVQDTFIMQSRDGTIDTHGGERSIQRINSLFRELDPSFRVRVQNFFSQPDKYSIKAVVDKILIRGVSQIREDFEASIFYNRDEYFNRGAILIDPVILNTFTILIDKQVHPPYSFYDRENFANREDFIGLADSSPEVFELLIQLVNNTAALGTLYRLIERLE